MAASLSADGKIWAACQYCRKAIWRYPDGKMWRDTDIASVCLDSPSCMHYAER